MERQVIPELTSAVEREVLKAVADGIPFKTAMLAAGIKGRTFKAWAAILAGRQHLIVDGQDWTAPVRERLQAFEDKVVQAQAVVEVKMVRAINEAGDVMGRSGVPEWRAKAWLLERTPGFKENFSAHTTLHVDEKPTFDPAYLAVQQMTEAEVLELAGPEWAELVQPLPTASERDRKNLVEKGCLDDSPPAT